MQWPLTAVEALLAKGADARIATVGGFTALAAAVRGAPDIDRFTFGRCQLSTVKALLAAAPDLELPDNGFGRSARWAAWLGNCTEVLRVVDGPRKQREAVRSSPGAINPQDR